VKQWTDANHVNECWFAYFAAPFLLPSDYGIPCKLLPTDDTMSQQDIYLPPVLHGPILVSYGDLNGFEFGSRVLNPYESLFERAPDDVIVNSIAVYKGDYALPQAAAMAYVQQARRDLRKDTPSALGAARAAVALDPDGFNENMALGNAEFVAGDKDAAFAAYSVAMRRVADMEPTAQEYWRPTVAKQLAKAAGK